MRESRREGIMFSGIAVLYNLFEHNAGSSQNGLSPVIRMNHVPHFQRSSGKPLPTEMEKTDG